MKMCPQCKTEYFDNALEFCLDDGSKLKSAEHNAETPTVVNYASQTAKNTEKFSDVPRPDLNKLHSQIKPTDTSEVSKTINQTVTQTINSVKDTGITTVEIAPIIFAMAHNWWQWLYLDKTENVSVSSFLLSPAFLTWMVLLSAGIITGVTVLKRFSKKNFAYAGLVILAVNFILFLVPRR